MLAILPKGLRLRPPLVPDGGFLNTLDRAVFNLGPTELEKDFLMVSSPLLGVWAGVLTVIQETVSEPGLSDVDPCIFSLLTGGTVPRGDFEVTLRSDRFLKDRSRFGSRGFLSGRSRHGRACGSSPEDCLMFSEEVDRLRQDRLFPEKIVPEQL